jgi:hypothetical protein
MNHEALVARTLIELLTQYAGSGLELDGWQIQSLSEEDARAAVDDYNRFAAHFNKQKDERAREYEEQAVGVWLYDEDGSRVIRSVDGMVTTLVLEEPRDIADPWALPSRPIRFENVIGGFVTFDRRMIETLARSKDATDAGR